MRPILWSIVAAAAALAALTAAGPASAGDEDATRCASARKEVRYSTGYDHLVHVKNTCEVGIRCQVTTDVNPQGVEHTIEPGAEETFLTWRGSPAREFTFQVRCVGAAKGK